VLQNSVKHSRTKRVEVQLRKDSKALRLVVRDSGSCFDIETASRGRGLGLTSMRECARMVNGTFTIDSKPNGGTAIEVRVPFDGARFTGQCGSYTVAALPSAVPRAKEQAHHARWRLGWFRVR
jgi:signal transduction histidine kinase